MNIKKSNNRLFKRLKGYHKSWRDDFLYLAFKELKQEEFILRMLFIAVTDWDPKHYESYGTFYATNKDLAGALGWESESTVSRYKKSLLAKGYIEKIGDRYKVKDFERYVNRKKMAKKQEVETKTQVKNANKQDELAEVEDFPF